MTDSVMAELVAWGQSQPDIRAMILTSTRAIHEAPTDRFSDYDVILLTSDVAGRYTNREWLKTFGDVVIDWWDPLVPDPETGLPTTGNVVYYPGTRKIDFTLWPPEQATIVQKKLSPELDAGYRVMLDKDNLTTGWPTPSGRGYAISLPNHDEYYEAVNDFFIGVPYVITALLRGELLPAKWVLDYDMRYEYLLPMLKWYAVTLHGPHIRIGNLGKGLQKWLPADTWQQLERTYAELAIAESRTALHEMIALFRSVAEVVADSIGCEYPAHLHDRVMHHIAALEQQS